MALHYYSLYIWLNIDSWSPMCKENITRLGTLKAQIELAHKFKKLTQYGDTAKHDETCSWIPFAIMVWNGGASLYLKYF